MVHNPSGWKHRLAGAKRTVCRAVFWGLLVLAMVNGCDLFMTRTPEEPGGSSGEGWNLPLTPREVLTNMENSIGRRSDVDYHHNFASEESGLPPFRYLADPQSIADNPGRLDSWGLVEEKRYATTLFNPANLPLDSISTVTFTVTQEQLFGDSARVNAGYSLHLGHLRPAPRVMEGQLEFNLLRGNDGGWYIHRWSDLRAGGHPCWSDLKAKF